MLNNYKAPGGTSYYELPEEIAKIRKAPAARRGSPDAVRRRCRYVPHERPRPTQRATRCSPGRSIALLTIPLLALVLFATAASPAETLLGARRDRLTVVLLLRIELALLFLVAAGSLEEAFLLSSNPQLTMTKIAGAICFASFARYALTSRRPLLFDRSHAVVIGILLARARLDRAGVRHARSR